MGVIDAAFSFRHKTFPPHILNKDRWKCNLSLPSTAPVLDLLAGGKQKIIPPLFAAGWFCHSWLQRDFKEEVKSREGDELELYWIYSYPFSSIMPHYFDVSAYGKEPDLYDLSHVTVACSTAAHCKGSLEVKVLRNDCLCHYHNWITNIRYFTMYDKESLLGPRNWGNLARSVISADSQRTLGLSRRKQITFFQGLLKLMVLKNIHDMLLFLSVGKILGVWRL